MCNTHMHESVENVLQFLKLNSSAVWHNTRMYPAYFPVSGTVPGYGTYYTTDSPVCSERIFMCWQILQLVTPVTSNRTRCIEFPRQGLKFIGVWNFGQVYTWDKVRNFKFPLFTRVNRILLYFVSIIHTSSREPSYLSVHPSVHPSANGTAVEI